MGNNQWKENFGIVCGEVSLKQLNWNDKLV